MAMTLDELPPRLKALVEAELMDDEPIIWIAQPDVWQFCRDAMRVCKFGVVLLLAAIAGVGAGMWPARGTYAIVTGGILIASLVVAFGALLVHEVLSARRRAMRTVYILTERRAILMHDAKRNLEVQSVDRSDIIAVCRNERSDGSGDLHLRVTDWLSESTTFEKISSVRKVFDLVQNLKNRSTSTNA